MATTLKKDSVVFIDDFRGYNNGISVAQLKELLKRSGITVVDTYSSCVTHFAYCLSNINTTQSSMGRYSDCMVIPAGVEDQRCHIELCQRAQNESKILVSIDRLYILAATLRMQIGYSVISSSGLKTSDKITTKNHRTICIKDKTNHYKAVSLVVDITQYCPPSFNRDCPQGISPFIPGSLYRQMLDDLKRKLINIRNDRILRSTGRISEATWKIDYLKRNVKKKQTKSRTCELCRVSFNDYIEHVTSIEHINCVNSTQYFGFLNDVFNRLLSVSWRSLLVDARRYQQLLQYNMCGQMQFPQTSEDVVAGKTPFPRGEQDQPSSPHMSSLSTDVNSDTNGDCTKHVAEGMNISLQPASSDSTSPYMSRCYVREKDHKTWLFPQFHTYIQVKPVSNCIDNRFSFLTRSLLSYVTETLHLSQQTARLSTDPMQSLSYPFSLPQVTVQRRSAPTSIATAPPTKRVRGRKMTQQPVQFVPMEGTMYSQMVPIAQGCADTSCYYMPYALGDPNLMRSRSVSDSYCQYVQSAVPMGSIVSRDSYGTVISCPSTLFTPVSNDATVTSYQTMQSQYTPPELRQYTGPFESFSPYVSGGPIPCPQSQHEGLDGSCMNGDCPSNDLTAMGLEFGGPNMGCDKGISDFTIGASASAISILPMEIGDAKQIMTEVEVVRTPPSSVLERQ